MNIRLKNHPNPFASEVFLEYENYDHIPIHPRNFRSKNLIQIDHFPTMSEWKSIFGMFPFKDKIEFSDYFIRVSSVFLEEELNIILEAYGMPVSAKSKKELERITSLRPVLKKIFLEKNIPVSILIALSDIDTKFLEQLANFLLKPYIKNNIAKEILDHLADMSYEQRNIFLKEIQNITNKITKEGLFFLNRHYKRILHKVKYPAYTAMKKEIDNKLSKIKIPKFMYLGYDPFFEENAIFIKAEIKKIEEISQLKNILGKAENKKILTDILKIL